MSAADSGEGFNVAGVEQHGAFRYCVILPVRALIADSY